MKATNLFVFAFLFAATEEAIGGCFKSLGMESRSIKDSQVTASSTMSDLTKPGAGRLNNKFAASLKSFGAWCASTSDSNQYFQVDLSTVNNITAIATQGTDIAGGHWVTEYTVSYSCDGRVFHPHSMNDSPAIFKGNNDSKTVVANRLADSLPARFIRINPTAWNRLGSICLRVEVYGCLAGQGCPYPTLEQKPVSAPTQSVTQRFTTRSNQVTQVSTKNTSSQACSRALGMESGAIKDSQISASSLLSTLTLSSASRLHGRSGITLGSWCAKESDSSPYLQVDLLRDTAVTAVGTQGMVATYSWVIQYSLSYSCDGKTWSAFAENGKKKLFRGNRNSKHVARNKLHVPLIARYIRIRPLVMNPFSNVCLRAELYGCAVTSQAACSTGNVSDVSTSADSPSDQTGPPSTARGTATPDNTPTSRKTPGAKNREIQIISIVKEEAVVESFSSQAGKPMQRLPHILGVVVFVFFLRKML